MKISLEWLADYLPGPLDAATAAEALTQGGFPVEVIERHGDDTVIDVEITSNRGDLLSHVGIARELAALLDRPFKPLAFACAESDTPASKFAAVSIEADDLCPHYVGRVLRGVKIGPSPAWMVRRLEAVGLRSINNVVDVTNYVMFETGQPLHAFDLERLSGGRVVVRRARAGEKLVTIDGKEAALAPDMLTIADARRPVALAGVMGGRDSEVSESTVNIFLEAARFDPLSVRKTARAIVRSDSSYRFERGIDPTLPERASVRAAELILQLAGGELLRGIVEAGASGYRQRHLSLRLQRLQQVLGVELPVDLAIAALARLGLSPARKGDTLEVTVPSHRLDINLEIDLVEEIARVVGYDQVPVRERVEIQLQPLDPTAASVDAIRSVLIAAGYFEAVTVGFVSDALAVDFSPSPAGVTGASLPRASSLVRKEDASLRPSILPGLLESVRHNEKQGTAGAKLFEIGSTFGTGTAGRVDERRRLGLVGSTEIREVRGAVEALLRRLDANRLIRVAPENHPGFARGGCGRIEWGGAVIGHIGKIAKAVVDKLSLRDVPAAAELEMAPLLAGAQLVPQLRPLPKFPAVERDLSLVMPEAVRYDALESLVSKVAPQWMEDLRYVTTYRGKPLEKGTKSVTVSLVFRSPSETLTSELVEASVSRVIDAAQSELGATLRS